MSAISSTSPLFFNPKACSCGVGKDEQGFAEGQARQTSKFLEDEFFPVVTETPSGQVTSGASEGLTAASPDGFLFCVY